MGRECGDDGCWGSCGNCDDGDPCTIGTCDGGFCSYRDICDDCDTDADCDNGDPCDGDETCDGIDCQPGTPIVCDDGDICTSDICEFGTGCVNTIIPDCGDECESGSYCDDGDICTTDSCVNGNCEYDNICCNSDAGCGECEYCNSKCTKGIPSVCHGFCEPIPGCEPSDECESDSDCDDGDSCTSDSCVDGSCDNNQIPGCGDDCESDSDCDDGDSCTSDSCVDGSCDNNPISGCCTSDYDCDDGDVCNGVESCSFDGECISGVPLSCEDWDFCTLNLCDSVTGCDFSEEVGCGDGDPCTDDYCDPSGCQNIPIDPCPGCKNSDDCNDNDECTDDVCNDDRTCSNPAKDCDDDDSCTDDTCHPLNGCKNTKLECDGGKECGDKDCEDWGECKYDSQLFSETPKLSFADWVKTIVGYIMRPRIIESLGEPEYYQERTCVITEPSSILWDAGKTTVSCTTKTIIEKKDCDEPEECDDKYDCPEDEEELVCSEGDSWKKVTSYDCEEGECKEEIDWYLEEECGQTTVDSYECECKLLTYSVCTAKYTERGCEDGSCYARSDSEVFLKDCGVGGCVEDQNDPNYGHCKPDCEEGDDDGDGDGCPYCQDCFTWFKESFCTAGPDGTSCYLGNGVEGVCEGGVCKQSECDPPEGECEKCDTEQEPPKAVPDPDKNGASCSEGIPSDKKGFCWYGTCYEKNCENMVGIGYEDCGSGENPPCCNKNTETCCGGDYSGNPLCCNKETQTCSSKLNIDSFKQIEDILEGKSLIDITIQDIEAMRKIIKEDSNYEPYCETKSDWCTSSGTHKICPGGYQDACCPKTGPGSTCAQYDVLPDEYVPDIPDWISSILPGFIKPDFTIGMCGDKECPPGTFECSDALEVTGGKICCKIDKEVCSYPDSYGNPDSPFPPILQDGPPICNPRTYCEKGTTDCVYVDTDDISGGTIHLCCKDGEEVCITEPPEYVRCSPLPGV
jgi:hypothetical protein